MAVPARRYPGKTTNWHKPMIVPIRANLEGSAADRFLALARTLARAAPKDEEDRMALLASELEWASSHISLEDQRLAFEAAVRVMFDLERLGWQVREEGYGVELYAAPPRTHGLDPKAIQQEKQKTRAIFLPAVKAQLSDPTVRVFAKRMDEPGPKTGKKPITLLIAEGAELHARLLAFKQGSNGEKVSPTPPVRPYLQLATPEEVDEYTGLSLREIWRYFRFTWSIPQFSTPGRQLLYLVRDAAHPCHAVMGIIGLNNTALQMGVEREYDLGWSLRALTERLLNTNSSEKLAEEYAWLEVQLAATIEDIEAKGLVEPEEIEQPNATVIARLRRKAQEFDHLRDETLRELARLRSGNDGPLLPVEADETDIGEDHPPVAEEILNLEAKPAKNPTMQKARRHLVARKRAALLAALLQSRLTLRSHHAGLTDPDNLKATLGQEDVGVALQTILDALKSRFAGINILEISTCGAIPPYNHILGGKLAALLLYSPQIAADYQKQYSGPSIISSQIKNAEVRRENALVYLSTTSLYAQGSSQYERVKLPSGIISPDQKELRFRKLGLTAGFGTLQFMNETRQAVEIFLKSRRGFKDVNSIFGEGPSPKLRLLAAGLRELGFSPDSLMRHNRQRLIYVTALSPHAVDFLNNRSVTLADYILQPQKFQDTTKRIADFWTTRWLVSRMRHVPSMMAVLTAGKWKLSDRIPSLSEEPAAVVDSTGPISEVVVTESVQPASPALAFWRQLAQSGANVTSDSLSESELERLHVKLDVEDFIKDAVSKGFSLFLTGNAGDGKTHVLKRTAPELRAHGAIVVEDATATMRRGKIAPVLDRWREAVSSQVPFCIAINEYPLHLLRAAAKKALPSQAEELDRQCRNRLVYGPETEAESDGKNLLVIDLSQRNPLNSRIAGSMLDRLLSDPDLDQTSPEVAPMLKQNLERLRDDRIRKRLLALFDRLAAIGSRTTMRELWILLARLVLGCRVDLSPSYGDGLDYRYSDIMFMRDPRFCLAETLTYTDPAAQSHPLWDALLEDRAEILESGWWFGVPSIGVTVRPDLKEFQALKRTFYFEHNNGDKAFELEDADSTDFYNLMRVEQDDDSIVKRRLIQAINRAFCPRNFPGCEDNLYLWSGHRFHEQPTRSFLANRSIPLTQLRLFKPRIPLRVLKAIPGYQPDHLLLQHASSNGHVAKLRVDFPLFRTLQRLRRGLPRKLLPERDAFRLESFVEALDASSALEDRRIFSAHLERRELLEVQLTQDMKKYERITKHA
ncbi:MAG: DUF4338 domain-containing protein [Magnetococcales bacterium]|nr:DUF4338 domain-containing protein [Magnetococcales bacterium]